MDTSQISEKAAKETSDTSASSAKTNTGSTGSSKSGNGSGSHATMKHKAPVSLATTSGSGPTAPKQAKTTVSTSSAVTTQTNSKGTSSKVNNTNSNVVKGLAGLAQKFGPGTSKLPSPKGTPTKSNATVKAASGNGRKVSTSGETRVNNTKPGAVRPLNSSAAVKPAQKNVNPTASSSQSSTTGKVVPQKTMTVLEVPRTLIQTSPEKLRPSPALARQAHSIPYPIPGPINTTDTILSQHARLQGQVTIGNRINLVTPTSRIVTAGVRPINPVIRPHNSIVRPNTAMGAVNALVRPQTNTKQTVTAKSTAKPLTLKPLTFKPKPIAPNSDRSVPNVTSPVRQESSGMRTPTTPGGTHGGLPQMVPHPTHVTDKSPVTPRHTNEVNNTSTEQGRQKQGNSSGEQEAPLDLHRPKTVSVS